MSSVRPKQRFFFFPPFQIKIFPICDNFETDIIFLFLFQDNVFVNVVASIQYRALADKASDAFYKLSNTRSQIQAYVFDGKNLIFILIFIH